MSATLAHFAGIAPPQSQDQGVTLLQGHTLIPSH
jgi:hypothetical protein